MKTSSSISWLVVASALLVAGCETESIPNRVQEKSAVYANLQPPDRQNIDRGVIALGYSTDLVYMAMGHPTKVESNSSTDGGGERWTYNNFYPRFNRRHMRYATLDVDRNYLPAKGSSNPVAPVAINRSRSPMFNTNTVQGGSVEPADLPYFTLSVWFQNGKVSRIGIERG